MDRLRLALPIAPGIGLFALVVAPLADASSRASAATSLALPSPPVILAPIHPYRPGDRVWTNTAAVPTPAVPDANGCEGHVPSSGYIGHNVYAATSVEYSNYWYWSGSSSNENTGADPQAWNVCYEVR